LRKPTHRPLPDGLVICNPPYGERLGDKDSLKYLYAELGQALVREFRGWQAAVFTSDLDLGKAIGLRSHKRYQLYNGQLPASLLLLDLQNNEYRDTVVSAAKNSPPQQAPPTPQPQPDAELSAGARMFGNRLAKNRKRLSRWLQREGISCYRLYDADMPEYAVAVDVYDGHLHVAEYQAPAKVAPEAAERRLQEVMAALPAALGVPQSDIVLKQRRRQRGTAQYQKAGHSGQLLSVREGPAKLLINLHDYLDTGLFLDHRPLRRRIAAQAKGQRFLNLFCYTGAATVMAALGGARGSTSVDLSNTYLDWLRKNLAHNGLAESRHQLVRADCREWLHQAQSEFDLILLDPPSFSNSRRMADSFDVQRDHADLVRAAMQRLASGGTLYFSNNRRGFQLETPLETEFDCVDISADTIDPDYERNPRIHRCWCIRHRGAPGAPP